MQGSLACHNGIADEYLFIIVSIAFGNKTKFLNLESFFFNVYRKTFDDFLTANSEKICCPESKWRSKGRRAKRFRYNSLYLSFYFNWKLKWLKSCRYSVLPINSKQTFRVFLVNNFSCLSIDTSTKVIENGIFNITLTILLQIKSQLIINISPCLKYSYLYLISFEISWKKAILFFASLLFFWSFSELVSEFFCEISDITEQKFCTHCL